MNPVPLLVLALAVLVPFSEGAPMSRCELRDQLKDKLKHQNIRIDLSSLATVICEVEKVINAPVKVPTTAPTTAQMTPRMTFPTMAPSATSSNQPGLKLRGCIAIRHGKIQTDVKCITKHFEWVLRNASPECSSVSPTDFFKGCYN